MYFHIVAHHNKITIFYFLIWQQNDGPKNGSKGTLLGMIPPLLENL
jgi:hypothetical protein